MGSTPRDIGCKNEECIKNTKCLRFHIAKSGEAREIKRYSGNEQKGCGNYISKEKALKQQ